MAGVYNTDSDDEDSYYIIRLSDLLVSHKAKLWLEWTASRNLPSLASIDYPLYCTRMMCVFATQQLTLRMGTMYLTFVQSIF